jgi:hypothetical protein
MTTSEKCVQSGVTAILFAGVEAIEGLETGSHTFTFPASIALLIAGVTFLVIAVRKRA